MPDVEVRGLTKRFQHGPNVVDDISFTVPDGSCTTLLGPSGCGKTTTLRMLAGFEKPVGGTIAIGGNTVADGASPRGFIPANHRNVGFVFQSYALWPHMTVADQVEFPLRTRRMGRRDEIRRKAREALALVELEHLSGSFPSQLSGGQQQRVALARALVFEPSVLLLDEPLSNLDAELRKQMRSTLKQLHQRLGATFVYVTHDKAEALALADQILVMHDGRIVERGTPDEVYSHPTSAFSARFVSAANCVTADVKERTGDRAVVAIGADVLEGRLFGAAVTDPDLAHATVLLRPEDFVIAPQGSTEPGNTLHMTVETAVFMGSHLEVGGTVAGGQRLNVNAPTSTRVKAGEVIALHVDLETVRIVSA